MNGIIVIYQSIATAFLYLWRTHAIPTLAGTTSGNPMLLRQAQKPSEEEVAVGDYSQVSTEEARERMGLQLQNISMTIGQPAGVAAESDGRLLATVCFSCGNHMYSSNALTGSRNKRQGDTGQRECRLPCRMLFNCHGTEWIRCMGTWGVRVRCE